MHRCILIMLLTKDPAEEFSRGEVQSLVKQIFNFCVCNFFLRSFLRSLVNKSKLRQTAESTETDGPELMRGVEKKNEAA